MCPHAEGEPGGSHSQGLSHGRETRSANQSRRWGRPLLKTLTHTLTCAHTRTYVHVIPMCMSTDTHTGQHTPILGQHTLVVHTPILGQHTLVVHTHTHMHTGANLKGAVFDNSQMNGVNLRLASLKGASLRSCNLRYAVMACTDLEVCVLLYLV